MLEKILNSMSAREQKWLMRIVLHDLRIGLKQDQVTWAVAHHASDIGRLGQASRPLGLGAPTMTPRQSFETLTDYYRLRVLSAAHGLRDGDCVQILGFIHPQARDMFDVTLNLREVCARLCDG